MSFHVRLTVSCSCKVFQQGLQNKANTKKTGASVVLCFQSKTFKSISHSEGAEKLSAILSFFVR